MTTYAAEERYAEERERLTEQRRKVVGRAAKLAEKAQGREFGEYEQNLAVEYKAHADDLDRQITELDAAEQRRRAADEKARADQKATDAAMRKAIAEFGADIGLYDGGLSGGYHGPGSVPDRVPHTVTGGSGWAAKAASAITGKTSGGKAIPGGVDVPAVLATEVVALPQQPRRLVDLLTGRQMLPGKNYVFVRQIARNSQAGPVADMADKPLSTFTPVEVEGTAKVIAHICEPFPIRFMADYGAMTQWLHDEMEQGVLAAVERQCLAGDGTGENFTGLLHTSGTVAVGFTTDLLVTARKARTEMEMIGETPNAWLFHPRDLETIDLMREDGATGGFLVGGASPAISNVFGTIPRISHPSMPEGTAILGDFTRARLMIREHAHLDVDTGGELFKINAMQIRAEGRYDLAVIRPQSFAIVDLTAPPA